MAAQKNEAVLLEHIARARRLQGFEKGPCRWNLLPRLEEHQGITDRIMHGWIESVNALDAIADILPSVA